MASFFIKNNLGEKFYFNCLASKLDNGFFWMLTISGSKNTKMRKNVLVAKMISRILYDCYGYCCKINYALKRERAAFFSFKESLLLLVKNWFRCCNSKSKNTFKGETGPRRQRRWSFCRRSSCSASPGTCRRSPQPFWRTPARWCRSSWWPWWWCAGGPWCRAIPPRAS